MFKQIFNWLFGIKSVEPILSIVVASRGRILLLTKLLNSVFEQASKPSRVELILITDRDDEETTRFLKNWKKQNPIQNINWIRRTRSSNLNRDYINFGAKMACGKYVWGLGNDIEIDQRNYDVAIEQEIEEFLKDKPDRLAYIFVKDDTNGGEMNGRFSSFPIFTKEVVYTIGGIMPNEIPGWGADSACFGIWRNLIADRIWVSGTIKIIHHCHHNGRMARDEISKNMEKCSTNLVIPPAAFQEYVLKLNDRIMNATKI